jgi:hypothetical protein
MKARILGRRRSMAICWAPGAPPVALVHQVPSRLQLSAWALLGLGLRRLLGPVLNPAYPSTSASVAMRSYEAWLATQSQPEAVAAEIVKRSLVRDAAAAWALRLRRV